MLNAAEQATEMRASWNRKFGETNPRVSLPATVGSSVYGIGGQRDIGWTDQDQEDSWPYEVRSAHIHPAVAKQ
jgi:hypothetical protein